MDDLVAVCYKNGFTMLSPNIEGVNGKHMVEKFHRPGVQVLPWTVDTLEEMARMVECQVDGVITDYPVKMKEYLATH